MMSDIKHLLESEIEKCRDLYTGTNTGIKVDEGVTTSFKEGITAEIKDLSNLVHEATLSLARILSKQGNVSSKIDNHSLALNSFGKSIAVWEEAANIKQGQGQKTVQKEHRDKYTEDILFMKTNELICSGQGTQSSFKLLSHSAHSLQNTIHVKALSTALQMARSHHALAVEAVMVLDDKTTDPSKECSTSRSLSHHLCAFKLFCEIRRRRMAFKSSSLDGGVYGTRFKGAAKKIMLANRVSGGGRLTASGRDIGVVSRDRATNI